MRQSKLIFAGLVLGALIIGVPCAGGTDAPRPHGSDGKPMDGDDAGIARSAPLNTGDDDPAFWGHLTEDQNKEAVAGLKAFAEKSANTLKLPLHFQESRYFILYSDVSGMEGSRCLSLLDRMYGKLSELFALQKGQNVWRGKSLIFVFTRIEDYRLYERLIENNDPGSSSAMTHCFGDGMVHTAFYRHPDQGQFDHLLVHESVHGFLHRYRSPSRVPSWANEGLADEAAAEMIPNRLRARLIVLLAKAGLDKHNNSVGDFFTARHIDGWQYPIAETLAGWMIQQNRQGYIDFINGIKDGQAWDESLKKNFKMTPGKLLEEYGKALNVKGIKI